MSGSGTAPRGLLLDFGGVLTTNIWESFDAFCEAEGLPEGTVRRLFRDDPEALADLRMLETGELTEADFASRFGRRLGIEETDGLIERLFAALRPEHGVIGAVRSLRGAGVKTGLISNSWGTGIYDPRLLEELFDAVVISGEVGLHKPQPEIFRLGAERLGIEPEACVFVDDLRENVVGAEAVGMTAILHRDPAATVARLEELFGVAAD
ncbi:MAG TPA: HAD family phosphatase [Solirubrobacterales bacterium]|nr:HAD family phosphatase [Solirubrobacterales bacterium]